MKNKLEIQKIKGGIHKMKTIKLGAVLLMAFLLIGALGIFVSAQDVVEEGVEIEEAGTTPDSIFYGLENAMDRVSLAFTFNKERKAEKALTMAEERLAEAEAMFEKNKSAQAERARERHDFFVQKAEEAVADIESDGEEKVTKQALRKLTRVQNRIETHQEKVEAVHQRILERQADVMTEEQLMHIENVFAAIKNRSVNAEKIVSQRKENTKTKYKVLTKKSDEEVEDVLDEIEDEEGLEQARERRQERAEERIQKAEKVVENIATRLRTHLANAENLTEEQKSRVEKRINNFEVQTEERNDRIIERINSRFESEDDSEDNSEESGNSEAGLGNSQ